MARFNAAKKIEKTENLAGGQAYAVSPKFELVSILLTSFVQDQFYRSADDTVIKLRNLIPQVGYEFAAKAALFARRTFGMRSITHIVGGEVAANVKHQTWTEPFLTELFCRPDDMLEVVAYYAAHYGKNGSVHPMPNSLRRAVRETLVQLDAYKLAKYRGENKAIKMVDLVNLVRPKPTPAIQALVDGTLKSTETWETKLTQAGQTGETQEEVAELKGAAWKELLETNKLGYLALIRNIRNILQQAPDQVKNLCTALVNEKAIRGSKVFPFQIQTAIQYAAETNVRAALSDAMDISLANVPKFDGPTLVAVDTSGSMQGKPLEIASLFGAALFKSNDADILSFSTNAQYMSFNKRDSVTTIARKIIDESESGGTNFPAIFNLITKKKKKYERIIILSDMQAWMGYYCPTKEFNEYVKTVNHAKPFIYSFDLQGYGTIQFPEDKVACLAGFSDKVFDVMQRLEQDKNALVNEIEQISFT